MLRVVIDKNGVLVDSQAGEPWGLVSPLSVTDDPTTWPAEIPGGRLVVRCSDENIEPDPMRWMPSGWDAFDASVLVASQAADERGIELLIRPSASGMLGDAISTASWARRMESASVGLLLDPVGWLTGSMIADAEDHLRRIVEMMNGCAKIVGVQVPGAQEDLDAAMVWGIIKPLAKQAGAVVASNADDLAVLDQAD